MVIFWLVQDVQEIFLQQGFYLRECYRAAEFLLQGGDPLVDEAAGIDMAVIREVCVDVEGEAVGGDEAGGMYAYGADFAGIRAVGIYPYAGSAFEPSGRYVIMAHGADDYFFQRSDVLFESELQAFQVEEGIAHDLSRAVVGNITAAVYMVIGGLYALQELFVDQQVVGLAVTAKGVYMRVFAENNLLQVFGGAFGGEELLGNAALPVPGRLVIYGAPVCEMHKRKLGD